MAGGQFAAFNLGIAATNPAKDGGDPCFEFLWAERLGEIVVSTEIEAGHLFGDGINRRKENDRNARFSSQATTDRKAVKLRQHDIENNQIRRFLVEQLKSLLSVFCADHGVTRKLQTHHQNTTNSSFIVHHQNRGLGLDREIPDHGPGLTG